MTDRDRALIEAVIERNREVLRALSGADDVVERICPDCSFEDRNGHAPGCAQDMNL